MGASNSRVPTADELSTVLDILADLSTPFEEEVHDNLLMSVWIGSGYQEQDFVRTGEQWRKIGCQRDDPVSDIRGGGILALQLISHFLNNYPSARRSQQIRSVRSIEASNQPNGSFDKPNSSSHSRNGSLSGSSGTIEGLNYPWFAAGVNITRVIAKLFNMVGPGGGPMNVAGAREKLAVISLPYWHVMRDRETVAALFCYAFELLDSRWDIEKATYLDFPGVLARTEEYLVNVLTYGDESLPKILMKPS